MEDKIIYEIRENVVKINTMLENMAVNTDLKLEIQDEKIKVANKRITNLEDTNKWLWRAFASSIITTLTGLIMVIAKMTK